MRSKRLAAAADGKGGQQDDASEDKNIQPVTKKRKASDALLAVHVSSSANIGLKFYVYTYVWCYHLIIPSS